MKKYLNYAIFAAVVLVVVMLAVNHSRNMRHLVDTMANGQSDARKEAAATLIKAEQFMDAITGEPEATRAKVTEALEALGTAPAVKQTLALLKDQDKNVRRRAVETLQRIGATAPDNIKELVIGLKDGDLNVRKGTILALTEEKNGIGAKPGVVPAIVDIMKREAGARGPGGDVLGSRLFLQSGSERESVPLLLALLDEKDEGIRTGAGEALGKVGDKTAVPRLIQAMQSDTAQMRRVAIGAVALIADPSGEAALTEALKNPNDDDEARAQATTGLGKIATPTAIATLVNALKDDDLKIRSSAVAALARAARPTPEAATNALVVDALNAALRSESEPMRLGATQALQIVAAPSANGVLLATLQNSAEQVTIRAAAARALGVPGNREAVAPLLRALDDPAGEVNEAAQDALGAIGTEATEALLATLKASPTVAYQAAQSLAKQGKSALPALERAAQSSDPMQARWATYALGELGVAEARPLLEQLAKNPNPQVAAVAKEQLNRQGKIQ